MQSSVPLKDILFNSKKIRQLATEIHTAYPAFNKAAFIRTASSRLSTLELKARIHWIADCLKLYLPEEYREAARIILTALPPPNDASRTDGDFGDFIYAPYGEFIARYGCTRKNLSFSLNALREITMRFSAEDAIRPFINAFPQETIQTLSRWASDKHYHVRRLCSEGTRPKLPWSQKINIPRKATIPILDKLFCDPTRYVVRSVANHINDITKTDPDFALKTVVRWHASQKQSPSEITYLLQHGLRTLIKMGHPKAMKILGFSEDPHITVSKLKIPSRVKMNSPLAFSFDIQADKNEQLIIDYRITFQTRTGRSESRKVFKLKKIFLPQGKATSVSKSHLLREHMTTRKLYRGLHKIEIQINGQIVGERSFIVF